MINQTSTTNIPVVAPDIYYTRSPEPVSFDIAHNDVIGNMMGELGEPEILWGIDPQYGTLTADGTKFTFTPAPGFYGMTFVWGRICEQPANRCADFTVQLYVAPPDFEIVYGNDNVYRVKANTTLNARAPGLLKNATSTTTSPMSVTSAVNARLAGTLDIDGTIQLNSDGSFSYTAPDLNTTDAIEYEICDENNVCTKSTLYMLVTTLDYLPVKLARFEAAAERETARLYWETTEEVNASHFEVQRSLDGRHWHRLGEVKARGNSTTLQEYTFSDHSPAEGVNYYRLRMIDTDGTFEYSDLRSLNFTLPDTEITLAPNPVSDVLKVNLRDNTGVRKIRLYSLEGQVLLNQNEYTDAGIAVRQLPAGLYFLTITYPDGRTITRKVVKQ